MVIKPLDFQIAAKQNVLAKFKQGVRAVLLQSATASGKTVIAFDTIRDHLAEDDNNKVLFLVNLQVLVGQSYDTGMLFGIKSSVLHDDISETKNGESLEFDTGRKVLITMPETMVNTMNETNKLSNTAEWFKFKKSWVPTLIVIDEAHKATSLMYQIIRDAFPNAFILGLTATPYRDKNKEGEHLTEWYGDNLVTTISVTELIELGRLVQPIYKQFNYENDKLVDVWKSVTADHENKSTIIFTQDTQHSLKIEEAFLSQGISAKVVTSGSDSFEEVVASQSVKVRNGIYKDFDDGKITVLISVVALCEGFNCPRAHFCFLARTVGNIALYHQMIGRVLRAYEGKQEGFVCDFFNNLTTHGHIEDYQWTLKSPVVETANTNNGRELSVTEFNRAKRVYHCCTGKKADGMVCASVYDIKKNSTCKFCNTPHDAKVTGLVSDVISDKLGITDKKTFAEFISRLNPAMRNDEMGQFAKKNLTKRFGIQYNADGTLTAEFSFVNEIAKLGNSAWTKKIAFSAA